MKVDGGICRADGRAWAGRSGGGPAEPNPGLVGAWTCRSARSSPGGHCPAGARLHRSRKDGFILVGVLVVVMLASMVAISLMFQMRVEEESTSAGLGGHHAWAAAMAGVRKAMRSLSTNELETIDWRDNPDYFRAQPVFDDGSEQWRFTVFTGSGDLDAPIRHGLSAEAGKLNVNVATEEALNALPAVEPILSQALLDFIDEDNLPNPEGAEQAYYDTLARPYQIHNGPLKTLDELLLVRGFTKAILYGEDANQNFRLDANEDDGEARFPPDNANGALNAGLRPYLTVVSYEPNLTAGGEARAVIDDASSALPTNGLPDLTVEFIEALRRNKAPVGHPAALLEETRTLKDEEGKEREYSSGVGVEELPAALDLMSDTNAPTLFGKIHVGAASAAVLQTIPGIDESLAEAIVSARAGLTEEQLQTPAWLFSEGVVDAELFRKIAPRLTARGYQYSFRVLGYGARSGQFRLLEVIVDTAGGDPRVIYLRDLTRLGLPFEVDSEAELSAGDAVGGAF